MTAAQKTAKSKFKQAIAYRQKTGVSLKEAFAHIYGKKVGAVKKKAAPKKKAAKKVAKKVVRKIVKKKAAPKKVANKKLTSRNYDKRYQALRPGKRVSESGNIYYENRANRSDRGKLLGIGALNIKMIDELKQANDKLVKWQNILLSLQFDKKEFPMSSRIINIDIKRVKDAIKEQKLHIAQLKKNIK
jgi:hypothetical protein